jgi:MFS family permease
LAGWPGWEQLYWSERVESTTFNWVNALIPAAIVAAIVLAGFLGHVLAYRWLTTGKEKFIRPTYIAVLVAATAVVLLTYPAFLLVGTYREYHFARAAMGFVWENTHGFTAGAAIIMSYFLAATLYVYFKIRKEGRAVDET